MKKIDLKQTPEKDTPSTVAVCEEKEWYPCLYINGVKTDLADVPEEGTAAINYRVKNLGKDIKNNKSNIELEVLDITFGEGKKKAPVADPEADDESEIEKGLQEAEKETPEEGEEKPDDEVKE